VAKPVQAEDHGASGEDRCCGLNLARGLLESSVSTARALAKLVFRLSDRPSPPAIWKIPHGCSKRYSLEGDLQLAVNFKQHGQCLGLNFTHCVLFAVGSAQ
jgi:hypothetical protein